jgi:anaerobic selenocysteine-containing dehydrogenase
MLYHIVNNNLYDTAFVQKWVLGFDELKKHLVSNGYTPEWAAAITDVPATKLNFLLRLTQQPSPLPFSAMLEFLTKWELLTLTALWHSSPL